MCRIRNSIDMPMQPGRACTKPGCRGVVRADVCSVCGPVRVTVKRQHDERRGNFRERGYDSRWDKVRVMYLREHPTCERCAEGGRVTLATLVHHKKPLRDGGELVDLGNLQAVCASCHGEIHAELDRQRSLNSR